MKSINFKAIIQLIFEDIMELSMKRTSNPVYFIKFKLH